MVCKGYTFTLTDEEHEKLEKWYKKVTKKVRKFAGQPYFGPIGGGVTLKIIPTSIGDVVIAKCMGKKIVLRELS